jgi:hypothetical protein
LSNNYKNNINKLWKIKIIKPWIVNASVTVALIVDANAGINVSVCPIVNVGAEKSANVDLIVNAGAINNLNI